jgi:hypothetical protein
MDFPSADFIFICALCFVCFAGLETITHIFKPAVPSAYRLSVMTVVYGLAVVFIATQFFAHVLPDFRPYPYADDWIYALPLKFSTVSEWIEWAFAQHVDHRIPIQKLSNYLLLRATGFDFRYIVALNYLLASATATMLLYVAKAYRGSLNAGDLMIPLALLSFGTGYSLWGFQFQFVSSIFFMALFVFLGIRFARSGRTSYLNYAALSLIACTLCGMNGVLFATCSTIATLGWLFAKRPAGTTRAVVLFMLALLVELVIWKTWKPSAASGTDLNLQLVVRYMYSLIPSSMIVFSFQHISWKFLVVSGLFIASMGICLRRLISRTLTIEDFLLVLGATCSFVVMLSVAFGRSKAQGQWNSVIGMHYGMLSIFMPALSWIVVSKFLSPRVSAAVGVLLAGVFLASFIANSDWRFSVINSSTSHQNEIVAAMKSGMTPDALADKYFPDFNWLNDPTHRASVTDGIKAFRAAGATMYGQ